MQRKEWRCKMVPFCSGNATTASRDPWKQYEPKLDSISLAHVLRGSLVVSPYVFRRKPIVMQLDARS